MSSRARTCKNRRYTREATAWRRITIRRFRRRVQAAIRAEREMPILKRSQGWISW